MCSTIVNLKRKNESSLLCIHMNFHSFEWVVGDAGTDPKGFCVNVIPTLLAVDALNGLLLLLLVAAAHFLLSECIFLSFPRNDISI